MSLDDQGLIDLSKLEAKDYSKLLLNRNPFPSTAIPYEIALTTADRQEILRRFTESISILFSDKSSSVTVLLGDYGAGKSHMLKLFKASVNSRLVNSEKPMVAIYVKSPGRSMRDFLLYLVDDLGREFLTNLAENQIMRYLAKVDPLKYLPKGKKVPIDDVAQVPAFLMEAQVVDLIRDMEPMFSEVKNADLVRAFLILPHSELGQIGWKWFVGSYLGRTEQQLLGINSSIEDARGSEEILNSLIKLLQLLGLNGLVILVDEFEALTLVTGPGRGIYQDALRHLIDSHPQGIALFFAITPAEWNKLTQNPSALERRLTGSVLDLHPFSDSETRELIQKYLKIARIADFESRIHAMQEKSPEVDPSIFPFTPDGIMELFTITKGIVFKIVSLSRICVDGLLGSNATLINSDFVKAMVKKEGFR